MIDRMEQESLKKVFTVAKKHRIPISCSVELTEKCNFKCPHCFIKDVGYNELSIADYCRFIDQFKALGGVYVTLTGGEALTHSHFYECYVYACQKGLNVSVFSNGYLINKELISLFRNYPPGKIEISLYGASPEVYRLVTKEPDAFEVVTRNIDLLQANGIPVRLKTTLFQTNKRDFFEIQQLARSKGISFKYDYKLMPKRNGDLSNLCYQIPPKEIIELEKKNGKTALWVENKKSNHKSSPLMFDCGAARYSCFLSSRNELRICAAATFSSIDLQRVTFSEAWGMFEKYTRMSNNHNSKCIDCKKAALCDTCPMWGYIMTNDPNNLGKDTSIHCDLATEREEALKNEEY